MLVVGILLKNVPYNIGQFGRADCVNSSQIFDSINELDSLEEHGSFKRSVPDDLEYFDNIESDEIFGRVRRSSDFSNPIITALDENKTMLENNTLTAVDCDHRYIGHELDPSISRVLRTVCLTVILLMAGLELDPVALLKLSAMVIRATFIPCFVEAGSVAVLSHFVLGFPWTVGFMLGFVLAAVSPAVIIPCLMNLSQRGYGVAKGIPTLVIAACSADDVVAISGFGIFLGFTFNKDAPLLDLVFHGPIEIAIGISFGITWGLLVQWIPNKGHDNLVFFRWLILFGGGLVALFCAHIIHYDGAGGLAAITMAFVAGMKWRKEEGWDSHNPVMEIFQKMWLVLEPVIFALIGTEIQIHKIDPETLGWGILVLVLSLGIRMFSTFLAVMGGNLNAKERIFMSFAWVPKATVQAALGPLALDMAKKMGDTEFYHTGNQILTMAVLSILITAPLGSVAIMALGPRLLNCETGAEDMRKHSRGEEDANKRNGFDHDNKMFIEDHKV
jgi:NhaP-type Na+/H+ or K+/H+ antiporter